MKIFISGQKSFGKEVFETVRDLGHEVVGVCSPRGRAKKPDALFVAAEAAGHLPVSPQTLGAVDIRNADLIVCAHNHAYISREIRNAAKHGAISYHPSLLPRHRGRDAVEWTIRMHDATAGGTWFVVDDGIDTGPIIEQEWCWVNPGMTASDLWRDRLFPMGLMLLQRILGNFDGGFHALPQPSAPATFEPAINPPRMSA